MGSPLTGREITIAVKKASAWRTAVAVGALNGLLVKANTLTKAPALLPDQPLGTGFETSTEAGKDVSAGSLDGETRYEGAEWVLLAMAMGAAGAPTQIAATLAYQHTLQLTAGNFGLFATVAQKMKSDLVFEWPSVKPGSFTLKGEKLVPSTFAIQSIAAGLVQDSVINDLTALAAVTYRDKKNRIICDENAYVRVNAAGGAGLSSGDNLPVASWELAFVRPLEGDHVLDASALITEPVGTGFVTADLTLHFPQFIDAGATLLAALGANPPTAYKIEVFVQGGTATGAQKYRLRIQIPQAFLYSPSPGVSGPGKIPHELKFRLTQSLTAPTGMAGVTNPFAIQLVNLKSEDYLA
jgi:hypothetical protein